jgi:hypothetical protein
VVTEPAEGLLTTPAPALCAGRTEVSSLATDPRLHSSVRKELVVWDAPNPKVRSYSAATVERE